MDVVRQFTGIAATLALLAVSLWWLRRKGLAQWRRARPGQLMEVIESRALAPGHTLHLVRVADRGLSLFLTLLIVSPVLTQIHETAWVPMQQGSLTSEQAIERAGKPLSAFLMKYAREKDIKLFLEISHAQPPRTPDDLEWKILVPAY